MLLGLGLVCLTIGSILSQPDLVGIQMTYGNFDIPGKISFINRLLPGTQDFASRKEYVFTYIKWEPFIILVGIIFPFMLFWGLWKNREYWRDGITRVFSQWACFVISRLGVLRASQMYPIRRSCMGTFPFLNCQACEMASGACPIGLLQNLIIRGYWPFYLVGSMVLFGLVLGKSICGWLCPFGFISDLIDRFSLRKYKVPPALSHLRYWALGLTIIASLLYVSFGIRDFNFYCSTVCISGKILGIFPYYLTTADDSFYPISGWLFDLTGKGFIIGFHVGLTLLTLVAMLLISGRLFCRTLCPLGGFWGLFNGYCLAGVRHSGKKCSGCGNCEKVCPMGVSAQFSGFVDRTSCMSCGKCVKVCEPGAREFRWEFPSETMTERARTEEKDEVDPLEIGYGSFFNRIRRDFYVLAMSVIAKKPIDMARYAFDQTDFYRKFYRREPELFESLPVVKKKDIGSCDPYLVLSKEMAGQVSLYGETTGSSGYPTPAFYTDKEFYNARVLSKVTPYIGVLQEALAENRAVINGLTFGFTIAGMSFGDFLQHQGGMVANVGTRSTIAPPDRMVRAMTRLRPSLITGTPIDFLAWMRILEEDHPNEADEIKESLRGLISTAELCADSRRRAIEKAFCIKHIDVYACVEGFFSVPCPCGEKHILPIYHTELFDPDLNCIGLHGEGRIAFTNLVKKSSPLVRYLLDDFVTIFPSKCKFGFKKSVEPHGRYELTIVVNGKRYGVRHFEEAIFQHGLFGDYRVVLEDKQTTVTLEEYGRHDPLQEIEESLSETFSQKLKVETVPFGTITKYREIRQSKPILKVEDRRSESTQKIPEYL